MELFHIDNGSTATPTAPTTATRDYWRAMQDEGYVELIREPAEGASLGYAEPVEEMRHGRRVAVAYAIGTPEERLAEDLRQRRESAVISPFQARAALAAAGLLPTIEAMMADAATPEMVRLAWAHASEFRRSSPMLQALANTLGLDDTALDELFESARGISA